MTISSADTNLLDELVEEALAFPFPKAEFNLDDEIEEALVWKSESQN
jgi:hypothetical protein